MEMMLFYSTILANNVDMLSFKNSWRSNCRFDDNQLKYQIKNV